MPIGYSLVERGNPRDPNAPKKFYATQKSLGEVNLRQLAEQIAEISTVSAIDVYAVLEAFIQTVPQLVAEGKIVRLGEFGSFHATLESEGAESAESFTSSLIKKVNLRFRPGKLIKRFLKSVTFKLIK